MATATIVRPSSTVRRKDTSRSALSEQRNAIAESSHELTSKKRKRTEPYIRDSQYILRKHNGKQPSFVIHLHSTHFRFDGQDGSFAYDSPMKIVLKHLQLQTVPHDMLEELLGSNVPFYDGCLIVEVHNHRAAENGKEGNVESRKVDDVKKFSMHTYNQHITPSPFAPYPSRAQLDADSSTADDVDQGDEGQNSDRPEKEGPKITTIVLHPTEQTRHEEMLILAKTPAADVKRRKADNPAPHTPLMSVTPTSLSGPRVANGVSQKMALDQNELYSFQGEMLVATEPPLYLEPAEDAQEAQAVMDMLEHPLHSARPPAAKERKRTTAEMAADDAQAAETERRLLIMDERIKPSARTGAGTVTGENQAAAASLGFSRFKTIELVRQKIEEAARIKKIEEERAQQEKRQYEEQMQAQQKQQQAAQQQKAREMQAEQNRRTLLQQQQAAHQRQQAMQAAQQQSQQEMLNKMNAQQALMHNNPQMQNNTTTQQQQMNGFQHQVSATQASPLVAQQTPLMPHSSPIVAQNGFPMLPTSSQGAGSPARPPSAMQQTQNAMARGQSQQTHGSHNGTPHVTQGNTPSLANAVPNRNMSQTPRMNPSSPLVGTPATLNMNAATPRMNGNLSTAQDIMLQHVQNGQQSNGMPGQPAQNQVHGASAMSPEQVQFAQNMSRFASIARQNQLQAQQAQQQGNPSLAAQYLTRAQQAQQQYNNLRQRLLGNGQVAGSNIAQQSPAMAHAHPNGNGIQQQPQGHANQTAALLAQQQQHMAQQQQQAIRSQQQQQQLARHQAELRALMQQHGGQLPPQVLQTLPAHLQAVVHKQQQMARMQHAQAQAQARNQAQVQARMGMPVNQQGSPQSGQQYMQNMQALRNGLAMQMQGQQQQNQQNGADNIAAMTMNMNLQQQLAAQQRQQQQQAQLAQQRMQQQQQQQNGAGDLSQSFAAMQNALSREQGMH